ncbi:PE-PGRS family protein PE_PGRS3-like [Cydia amplana]|uniref:PE-PGRS family protein PE_PGRS3-like n=1 Tax=Cydia amplana TaxID=1869771 RepID=UPI002FE50C07
MKFTITLIALLSVTTSWAKKEKKVDELKDKREAPVGYAGSSHSYQAPSLSNEGASAISIGAGYSVGGAKPSYSSYEGQGFSGSHSSESLPGSGHATIQLAPITLQPSHGGLVGTDLNHLMSQLQQQLNSGALSLQAPESYGGSIQSEGHSGYNVQEQAIPQYTYSAPQQQYSIAEQQHQPSIPSYAAGTKGLGSYSSTGPVLFNPTEAKQTNAPSFNYGAPSSGHSFGSGGLSLGSGAQYFAGAPGSFGESLGGGYALSGPYKSFGNSYASSGKNSFKPSAYIGSSVQADPSHGISALSSSYGAPSFSGASSQSGSHGAISLGSAGHGISLGSGHGGPSLGSSLSGHSIGSNSLGGHSLGSSSFGGHSLSSGSLGGHSLSSGGLSFSSGGHGSHGALSLGSGGLGASLGASHGGYGGGFGGGSSKYISNAYLPAKDSFGSLSSHSSGLYSPPATSYGIPNSAHAASSHIPQYYKSQPSYSFGAGSSSYKSPSSSVSSLKSYPKYSSGGYSSLSSQYGSPKDPLQGSYSENTYNTIKYSEELKASPQ